MNQLIESNPLLILILSGSLFSMPPSSPHGFRQVQIKMKLMRISFFTAILASGMLSAEPLYNVQGTDPSFAAILESSGGKPGERFNRGGAPGSSIDVNNELLEKQVD